MKPRSKKQKGKRFEEQVANIINNIFNVNAPKYLSVQRTFTSGAAKFEKGDISFGILYQYFKNIVIECKKWKDITKKNSIIKKLYKEYSNRINEDEILWLIIADNYEKPKIVFKNSLYKNIIDILIQKNSLVKNITDELVLCDFEEFLILYKDDVLNKNSNNKI